MHFKAGCWQALLGAQQLRDEHAALDGDRDLRAHLVLRAEGATQGSGAAEGAVAARAAQALDQRQLPPHITYDNDI